jgi:hypothetical protein
MTVLSGAKAIRSGEARLAVAVGALTGAVLQQRQEITADLGKSCQKGKQAIPKRRNSAILA